MKKLSLIAIYIFLLESLSILKAAGLNKSLGENHTAVFSHETSQDFSLPAMGTYWTVSLVSQKTTIDKERLQKRLSQITSLYDETFSDWSDNSELRKLEKRDLTNFQQASPLFIKGLKIAYEAYFKTNQAFDVTVGDKIWNHAPLSIGMKELEWGAEKTTFRFKKDPHRLTFGGIAKGMAVGALAEFIYSLNLEEFVINAGGGNLAYYKTEGSKKTLIFESNSHIIQSFNANVQHIVYPASDKPPAVKFLTVRCVCEPDEDFVEKAGMNDVYSTALTLDQKIDMEKGCSLKI